MVSESVGVKVPLPPEAEGVVEGVGWEVREGEEGKGGGRVEEGGGRGVCGGVGAKGA
jgi:hypothetical protein